MLLEVNCMTNGKVKSESKRPMFNNLVCMVKNKDSENDTDSFKVNFAGMISFKEKT